MKIEDEAFYTVPDLKEMFGVPKSTIFYHIRAGRINAKGFGRQYVIEGSEVKKFLESTKRSGRKIRYENVS